LYKVILEDFHIADSKFNSDEKQLIRSFISVFASGIRDILTRLSWRWWHLGANY